MKLSQEHLYKKPSILTILIAVLILRLWFLDFSNFNLFFDEAQYWIWSQDFSWGYYSKPPVIAWVISLSTALFSDNEFGVRAASPFIHSITAYVIYLTALQLFDKKTAFYSFISYLSLPAVSFSSALISTDVPLLMFWALSLYFFTKALSTNRIRWWLLAGIAAGFGLLSKYNMLLFLVSTILYICIYKDRRKIFRNPGFYTAIASAAIIFLPNVIWNFNNGLASFLHTKDNASGEGISLHFNHMFEFIGAQFGVFGPVLFGFLLYIFYKTKEIKKDDRLAMLALFTIIMLAVITTVSLFSRAHANWAAPSYISATILVIAYMLQNNKEKWIKISLGINIFTAILLFTFPLLYKASFIEFTKDQTNITQGKIKDPLARLNGWKDLGEGTKLLLQSYPDAYLLTNSRKLFSEIAYYARPYALPKLIKWNPKGTIKDHFDMTTNMNNTKDNQQFIYISQYDNMPSAASSFDSSEKIGHITDKTGKVDFYVFLLEGFNGYK